MFASLGDASVIVAASAEGSLELGEIVACGLGLSLVDQLFSRC